MLHLGVKPVSGTWTHRRGLLALALVFIAAISSSVGFVAAVSLSQTPEGLATESPGDLVRWQPIPAIGGHPTWRILYVSTGLDGEPTAVSGVIAIPAGPLPADGFPLMVIGHPTAGLGRQCAPSLLLQAGGSPMADLYQSTISPYLDDGFAVVMTDYQGLGVAGEPSYLIGDIEGRNVLDSIRAARQFPEARLSDTTLLIGHSQGGHAIAFAVQLAPDYAPELTIDGAVLAAPALDPSGIFTSTVAANEPTENTSLLLMVMSAWSSTYSDASLDDVTTAAGQELIESGIANTCLIEAGLAAGDAVPSEIFLPDAAAAWADLAAANTPNPGSWMTPMLILHGTADEVIDPAMTADFVQAACASGAAVDFREVEGANHFGLLAEAQADILAWMRDRVAGIPAESTCS